MQQDIANAVVSAVGIWTAATMTIIGTLAPLIGLVTSAVVKAGWLSADSGFAAFVAKLFPLSLHAKSGETDRATIGTVTKVTCLFAVLLAATGCINRGDINIKVQQALVFEDKVHAQVATLKTVFDAAVPMLPADKQAEYRAKLADAYATLQLALDAKDDALKAALEASAETVDVSATVQAIVAAVQDIIAIVAAVGANPLFIQEQQAKALKLGVAK